MIERPDPPRLRSMSDRPVRRSCLVGRFGSQSCAVIVDGEGGWHDDTSDSWHDGGTGPLQG